VPDAVEPDVPVLEDALDPMVALLSTKRSAPAREAAVPDVVPPVADPVPEVPVVPPAASAGCKQPETVMVPDRL
jgi:hypothetical protein